MGKTGMEMGAGEVGGRFAPAVVRAGLSGARKFHTGLSDLFAGIKSGATQRFMATGKATDVTGEGIKELSKKLTKEILKTEDSVRLGYNLTLKNEKTLVNPKPLVEETERLLQESGVQKIGRKLKKSFGIDPADDPTRNLLVKWRNDIGREKK